MLFFDTNVLVYLRDPRDPAKTAAARDWLAAAIRRDAHVVSPQVIGEFLHILSRRSFGYGHAEISAELAMLSRFSRGETTNDVLARAAVIKGKTGFRLWDCVILVNAIDAGCSHLLSEDYEHGRVVDGVMIINPFLQKPETVLGALRNS